MRAKKLAEEQAKHDANAANHETTCIAAERQYWQEQRDKAALSAVTGRLLAVGITRVGSKEIRVIDCTDEADALEQFWKRIYEASRRENAKLIGFNINNFDIPFLVRRSWVNNVDVPDTVFEKSGKYLDPIFVDLMAKWSCGQYREFISLNNVARALGVGSKPTDENGDKISGKDFSRLWFGTPEQRQQAEDYCRNDVVMTLRVAERLGVVV